MVVLFQYYQWHLTGEDDKRHELIFVAKSATVDETGNASAVRYGKNGWDFIKNLFLERGACPVIVKGQEPMLTFAYELVEKGGVRAVNTDGKLSEVPLLNDIPQELQSVPNNIMKLF